MGVRAGEESSVPCAFSPHLDTPLRSEGGRHKDVASPPLSSAGAMLINCLSDGPESHLDPPSPGVPKGNKLGK